MAASNDFGLARRKLARLTDTQLVEGELETAIKLALKSGNEAAEADRLAYLVLVLRRLPKLLESQTSKEADEVVSKYLTGVNAAPALHDIILAAVRSDHKTVHARGQDALLASKAIAQTLAETRPKDGQRYFLDGLLAEPLQTKLVNKTELICVAALLDVVDSTIIPSDLLERVLGMVPLVDYPALRCRIVLTLLEIRAGNPAGSLISPLIPLLRDSSSSAILTHFSRYLFPVLFEKHPETYHELLATLQDPQRLPAWILIASSGFNASRHSIESLPEDMLTAAAAHPSTEVRIAAIALFTKGNGAIDQRRADLIKRALHWSSNVPSSEFRMSISSIMVNFFTSIRSLSAKARRVDPRTSMPAELSITAATIQPAQSLLNWMLDDWILPSLWFVTYTSSARILLALRVYFALVTVFEKNSTTVVSGVKAATEIRLELYSEERVDALIGCLASNFTEVRSRAEEILRMAPSPLPKYPSISSPSAQVLLESAYSCILGARNTEAEAGKALLRLVFEKLVRDVTMEEQASAVSFATNVIDRLESHIVASETDLVKGMAVQPLHGLLSAVREVLSAVDFENSETSHLWRPVLVRARGLVDRTWAVCRVVLSATAMQSTADHEIARAREALHTRGDADDGAEDEAEEMGDGDHLILLSGCWRAMKEAGDLLSTLIALPLKARTRSKMPLPQMWTDEEITSSGDLFLIWLHEIRHRGTFSKLALAFNRVVEVVRPFEEKANSGLVGCCRRWLQTEMDTVQTGLVSTTRRSAALPYCILSIVAGDVKLVDVALTQLFELARVDNQDSSDDTKVHAFNSIRVILLDARQAGHFERYFEQAVVLAVDAFASNNWNVRNVGLILLSTLLSRSFNNSKKQEAFGNRQLLAGRRTFHAWNTKFPLLLPFFAKLLTAEEAQLVKTEHSALFPILIVLRNLRATEEGREVQQTLLPLVESNLLSRDWQVREVASQAASSMVLSIDACSIIIPMLNDATLNDQNGLMGHLMLVERVINDVLDVSDAQCEQLEASLLAALPLLLRRNTCSPTREAFIRCVAAYGRLTGRWNSMICQTTIEVSLSVLTTEGGRQPGSDLLHVAAANLILAPGVVIQQRVARLLSSEIYEDVRLLAIDASTSEQQERIAGIAVDGDESDAVRIRSLEWLQSHDLSGGDVDALQAAAEQTRCIPLREAALPVLAHTSAQIGVKDSESAGVLSLVEAAAHEEQSHESRLSAVFALSHLNLNLYPAITPSSTKAYFMAHKSLYTLLIDDDEEVRAEASAIVGRGTTMVQGRAVDIWWSAITSYLIRTEGGERDLWVTWLWSVAINQSEIDDLAALLDPELKVRELFVPEPPNIFREPLIEAQRATEVLRQLQAATPSGAAASSLQGLETQLMTEPQAAASLSPIDPRREALLAIKARLEMIRF